MNTYGIIKKGEYYDSVTIMLISKQLTEIENISESAAVMGTAANKQVLKASGLYLSEFDSASELDLIIAFQTGGDAGEMKNKIEGLLKKKSPSQGASKANPASIDAAMEELPGANLALISVAGAYASGVAMNALRNNMNVMLFSDNVSIEKEIELKKFAAEKNLLVMGPDCGTAIINGVPLAFANVVERGNIGIVGAAGTGTQEVSCLISNNGGGISQAIGTGGRDVKKDVGGIMFLRGLEMLAADAATNVIVLVSKPPAEEVVKKVKDAAAAVSKPVVCLFLGFPPEQLADSGMYVARTLEEASLMAVELAKSSSVPDIKRQIDQRDAAWYNAVESEKKKLKPEQKFIRALFSGGTFTDEAQMIFRESLGDLYSNIPIKGVSMLSDTSISRGHTVIDLGDDEFTVGKPHPMIDFSLRCRRLLQEAADKSTAVILLDLVLGYGSNLQPADDIIPAIKKAREISISEGRYITFVASVTGTRRDPQDKDSLVNLLSANEVLVASSNAEACRLAMRIVETQQKGN